MALSLSPSLSSLLKEGERDSAKRNPKTRKRSIAATELGSQLGSPASAAVDRSETALRIPPPWGPPPSADKGRAPRAFRLARGLQTSQKSAGHCR